MAIPRRVIWSYVPYSKSLSIVLSRQERAKLVTVLSWTTALSGDTKTDMVFTDANITQFLITHDRSYGLGQNLLGDSSLSWARKWHSSPSATDGRERQPCIAREVIGRARLGVPLPQPQPFRGVREKPHEANLLNSP